jgi:hypothetical protein
MAPAMERGVMNRDFTDSVEQLRTIKQAAADIGLPYFKLARAVRAGLIPSYNL